MQEEFFFFGRSILFQVFQLFFYLKQTILNSAGIMSATYKQVFPEITKLILLRLIFYFFKISLFIIIFF